MKGAYFRVIFSLVAIIVLAFGGYSFVFAESVSTLSSDSKKAIDDREDQIKAIKEKIKSYEAIIRLKRQQGGNLAGEIDAIQAQIDSLNLQINLNQSEINALTGDIDSLETRISEKTKLIEQQKRILSEMLRTYYQDYSNDIVPVILTNDESFNFFQTAQANTDVNAKLSDLLDSVQSLRDSMQEEQKTLDEKRQEAVDLQDQLSTKSDYLESSQSNKEVLLAKTNAERDQYKNSVDSLEEQQKALEEEVDLIESGKLSQISGLPKGNGQLGYPLSFKYISQNYGKATCKTCGYKFHNGIDFAADKGTTVRAAADGKVVGSGNLGSYAYGQWIAIQHDGDAKGLVTLYGHLSKRSVSKGDKVDKGEKIGEVGSTGNSTGPHLHFTVFSANTYGVSSVNGKSVPTGGYVNPGKYLK